MQRIRILSLAAWTAAALASATFVMSATTDNARMKAVESNNLGIALLAQFKPAEAEAELKKALAAVPDYVPALVNLGIAQLAQVRYDEAVESFQRALLVDPGNIHAHYNLSLIYKIQGKTADGIREALSALAGDARDADLHYNLASLHQAARDFDKAIEEYEASLRINPNLLPAYYALGRAYISKGDMEQGRKYIKQHQALAAASNLPASSAGLRYGEQGRYSLAMEDPALRSSRAAPLEDGRITFVDVSDGSGILFGHAGGGDPYGLRSPIATTGVSNLIRDRVAPVLGGGVVMADLNGDGAEDLTLVNTSGKPSAVFTNKGALKFAAAAGAGAAIPRGSGMGAAAGDVDNDGDIDLAVSRYGGVTLLINDGKGGMTEQKLPPVSAETMAAGLSLADVDHDGDLDLLVAAMLALPNPPKPELKFPADYGGDRLRLFRNNGNGTWTDITSESGFDDGLHRNVGAVFSDFDNDRDVDVAVARLGGGIAMFTNNRDGTFSQVSGKAGLPRTGDFLGLCSGDYDRDGYMDLLATTWEGSLPRLFRNDGTGSFALDVTAMAKVPRGSARPFFGCAFTDIDNDGLLDALAVNGSDKGPALVVLRNLGEAGFEDATAVTGAGSLPAREGRGLVTGDLDSDGDVDFLISNHGGPPTLLRNDGGNKNQWVEVAAEGLHSNKLGVGTKIEVKAGLLWQKRELVSGSGYLSSGGMKTLFGLGDSSRVDALRLLWPGGVLQDEIKLASNKTHKVKELDRKGTSCPILYAWNGSSVAFITDFLGGSAFGYLTGPGRYNYPDTEEQILLPAGSLAERDGRYELYLNNQLEETIYFDQARLLAVDHPIGSQVFPDEQLMPGPPYPPARLFLTRDPRPPVAAFDHLGANVLPELMEADGKYVEGFDLLAFKGYAALHSIVLEFDRPLDEPASILLLTGWIDYADSTSNLAASQAGVSLVTPSLEARDPSTGNWVPAVAQTGFPAGLPKTMTVDLTGKLPAGTRALRLTTSMRIYWDQIQVAVNDASSAVVHDIPPAEARLRYRGFPRSIREAGGGPPSYDYASEEPFVLWKAHAGAYTRYGDVRELLLENDDLYVVTKAGDEIRVLFDPEALPPLPAGHRRSFILRTGGFGKDMDLNSARPHRVEPLPYHGMPAFPYGADESYPVDAKRLEYLTDYNTRIVKESVPPISP